MPKFTKQKALIRINTALIELRDLIKDVDHASYITWRRDTQIAISYIFGKESKQLNEFNDIYFLPNTYDPNKYDFIIAFDSGRNRCMALLRSFHREINDYWDEEVSADEIAPVNIRPYDRTKLLWNMTTYFDINDLETICFELGLDYESLKGNEKESKARGLILYCERTGFTTKLLEKCKAKRPQFNW